MVLTSGTLSLDFSPRKRLKLSLSVIWYSIWPCVILYYTGEVIQALQNEQFKHHDPVERRPACVAAVLRLAEYDCKNRYENVPVDIGFQLHKRIFELCEFFEQKMVVEKAEWVDVFHDSWSN